MKERSRAVAMMVLHMSSHIASGGQSVAQYCHFSGKQWLILEMTWLWTSCRHFNINWFITTHPQYPPSHKSISQRSSSRFHSRPGSRSSSLVHDLRQHFPLQGQINKSEWSYLQIYMWCKMFFTHLNVCVLFLLVQSCGHIDASLLSTASQKLSGHVRRSGEQVE